MRRGFLYLVAITDSSYTESAGFAAIGHAGSRLLRRGVERGDPRSMNASICMPGKEDHRRWRASGRWITCNNHQRPHTSHGGHPPVVVYFNRIETDQQVQAVA